MKTRWICAIAALGLSAFGFSQQFSRKIQSDAEAILSQMTLEEKISLIHGATDFATAAIPRLGLKSYEFTDGPHGVRRDRKPSTYFPTGISMASTWNPDLINRVGQILGRETKATGHAVLLGPAMNILRTPLGGRDFEYYTEDPFLASRLAVASIKGIQSQGVGACAKHYAANSIERERLTSSSDMDERTLREIYLPAFEAAVKEGGVFTLMAAYNKLNGQFCAENSHLIQDILKGEWGFKGFIMSDWGAVHSTAATYNNGLDLEMPGNSDNYLGNPLKQAFADGSLSPTLLDDKCRRILQTLLSTTPEPDEALVNTKEADETALAVARESIILLKNDNHTLPLSTAKIRSIAVIGPNADAKHGAGGGSSSVTSPYEVTPVAGLKALLQDQVRVSYAAGYDPTRDRAEPVPAGLLFSDRSLQVAGLTGEVFKGRNFGEKVASRVDKQIDFDWTLTPPIPGQINDYSVRWTGYLAPKESGRYELGLRSDDGSRLYLDGKALVEQWQDQAVTETMQSVQLEAGKVYALKIEFYQAGGDSQIAFVWRHGTTGKPWLDEAVRTARESDAAIIVAGTSHRYDSEGGDKPDMAMPGDQGELIRRVREANPRTIIVLVNGSPVDMGQWVNSVPAIVEAWYPGQEGGNALAEILFGRVNPSGKLPITFPKTLGDSPAHRLGDYPPKDGHLKYSEGVLVGYRWFDTKGIAPQFPFGHGLSYTSFEYTNLTYRAESDHLVVTTDITNSGGVAGSEVVQLYVGDPACSVVRPQKELKGFEKVHLEPGQRKTISFSLPRRAFSFYSATDKQWILEPGQFNLYVGSSSRDLRQRASFNLK